MRHCSFAMSTALNHCCLYDSAVKEKQAFIVLLTLHNDKEGPCVQVQYLSEYFQHREIGLLMNRSDKPNFLDRLKTLFYILKLHKSH